MDSIAELVVIERENVNKLSSYAVGVILTTAALFPNYIIQDKNLEKKEVWGGLDISYFEPHLKLGSLPPGVLIRKTKEELLQLCKDIRGASNEEEKAAELMEDYVNVYLSDLEDVLSKFDDKEHFFLLSTGNLP